MSMPGRSMGLDVGHVRIGVALSDPMGMIASPHSVIDATSPEQDAEQAAALARQLEARRIVIGLPLDQNGEAGPQARLVLEFIELLKQRAPEIDVHTQDERFSTAFAERALIGAGMRREKRKGAKDRIAAQQILQTWLDRDARRRKEPAS